MLSPGRSQDLPEETDIKQSYRTDYYAVGGGNGMREKAQDSDYMAGETEGSLEDHEQMMRVGGQS